MPPCSRTALCLIGAVATVLGCQPRAKEQPSSPRPTLAPRVVASAKVPEPPHCSAVTLQDPTPETVALPLDYSPGAYELTRFKMGVEVRKSESFETRVLLRGPAEGILRELAPRAQWHWPTKDHEFSWLMRLPLYQDDCPNEIGAYDPLTLQRIWGYRRPADALFGVESALQSDELVFLNLRLLSKERHLLGCSLVALRVADGTVAWEYPGKSCDHEFGVEHKGRHLLVRWTHGRGPEREGTAVEQLDVLDPRTGKARWRRGFPEWAMRLELDDESDRLLLHSSNKGSHSLLSVNLSSGRVEWEKKLGQVYELVRFGPTVLVQGWGKPRQLLALDARSGAERWKLLLKEPVGLRSTRQDGRYWVLSDEPPECEWPERCQTSLGYRVIEDKTGQLVTNLELPIDPLDGSGTGVFLDQDRLYLEVPAGKAAYGSANRIATYELPSGRLLWRGSVAQCVTSIGTENPTVLWVKNDRVYSCECDQVLRVYTKEGRLLGDYGVELCDELNLEQQDPVASGVPLTMARFTEPDRALRVKGRIAAEHVGIDTPNGWKPVEIFSGWVRVGDQRVRANRRGEFTASVMRRGWIAVHGLEPRGTSGVIATHRMVPPDVDTFDVGELEVFGEDQ